MRRHRRRQSDSDGRHRVAGKVLRRPDEWPFDRFSVIEPDWAGLTAVLIAGGPSLTREQLIPVERARAEGRCRVVAINDSYLLAPYADILYFADSRWWEWHRTRPEFTAFPGLKCSIENTGAQVDDDNIHMLRNAASVPNGRYYFGDNQFGGISPFPNALRTGGNGGFQVLNLAVKAEAAKIILLGYDMRFVAGKSHWHGGHKLAPQTDDLIYRTSYCKHFEEVKLPDGVQVINATPGSHIKRWGYTPIEEALGEA